MKTQYTQIEIEVIRFDNDDVIRTSGCVNPGDADYIEDL